jgi:hypothetical protein
VSAFPDLEVQATWLKPRLSCEVESTGVDENQLLKESAFKGLVFPKKPKPAELPTEEGDDAGDGKSAPEGKKASDAKSDGKSAPEGKKVSDAKSDGKSAPEGKKASDAKSDGKSAPEGKKASDAKGTGTTERPRPE